MKLIAGIDIGNSTTEVAIADIESKKFISSGITKTTGIKGTIDNVPGILIALNNAASNGGIDMEDIKIIRINEATPVIGDVAMETITETIITESTMIGHNPTTPGGVGLGIGTTVYIDELQNLHAGDNVICIVPPNMDFEEAANRINSALDNNVNVNGAIVKKDDAVLICNRLKKKIPIVDEVELIDKVPLNMKAAVEVANPGETLKVLSNPYGIATVFGLTPEETKHVIPVARALIGNRSAVVIKTPQGEVKERVIPAGKIILFGKSKSEVEIGSGAEKIMERVDDVKPLTDVSGEPGTNVGGMLERVKQVMSKLTKQPLSDMHIQDILAVDTFIPQQVKGGIAGEFSLENAVGLAAMVRTNKLPMQQIAKRLEDETGIKVDIAGVEANMAILGALTTPGTSRPIAILDMGGGSTDAAYIDKKGEVRSIHHAGAGDMVTMLIKSELGLDSFEVAENIKKYPLAKVESLFNIRLEDGTVQFFENPLESSLFARVAVITENGLEPISTKYSMEKIKVVRRDAKRKVFVSNAMRALKDISSTGDIRGIEFVVLVGGSALDFEIPDMISDALAKYGIVCGRGNIRAKEGPRNAVATGLVLSYLYGSGNNGQ